MQQDAYDQLANTEDHGWYYQARLQALKDLLQTQAIEPNPAKTILDVGCGTGGSTSFLSQYGEVIGIEPNEHAIALLKNRLPKINVFRSDIEHMNDYLQDKKFDLISILGVLYHKNVVDPAYAMKKIASHQRKGGYLVWNEACYNFLWREHDEIVQGGRRFTPGQMSSILEKAGYEPLRGNHLLVWAFPIGLVLALLFKIKKILGISAASEAPDHAAPSNILNKTLYYLTLVDWKVRLHLPKGLGGYIPGVSYILIARKK